MPAPLSQQKLHARVTQQRISDSVKRRGVVVKQFLLESNRAVFHDLPERADPLRE